MAVFSKTWAQLIEDVRITIGDDVNFHRYGTPGVAGSGQAIVEDALNRALVQVALDLKYKRKLVSYTVTALTASDTFSLATLCGGTDDFLQTEWIKLDDTGNDPLSQEDYFYVTAHEGDATIFAINNNDVVFATTVIAGKIIYLYYIPMPERDTIELRPQYLHLPKYMAAKFIHLDAKEIDDAKVMSDIYAAELQRCLGQKQTIQDGQSLIEPEELISE